jgi:hypothetical protein
MGERDSYLYDLMRGRVAGESIGEVHDLGSDVMIVFQTREASGDVKVGFIETHPTPDGRGCQAQVIFDIPEAAGITGPKWTLVSLDPLHIEPSVLCGTSSGIGGCGHHGFIRNGRWEDC